ncbi:helix-turn-helix domain-containing protein [Pseudoduganella umbonata]|uniref:Helix-turn-helix transcriptional regulator n=1 Tax=Pseudoduganella umbonata TaxID=864828 RepID=A0A4P8HXM5_9BURK|nr:helix-turn-helix transcriptional regulator [Pseudoduganella umbonata]MBB3222283.1 transcriptional regulator with XRE-family HTH domain [Pseudoduganella umbonata]QCP14813.1 helix-turn-helix transcriptional regulator [Pseudoduganella umbonata]
MNFGEKLKQIRTQRGLTQPQFAEQLGIEQSYLSKLENDKSVPSAEMLTSILAGIGMDTATFLQDVDKDVLATTLRHIPAVDQLNRHAVAVQVHRYRRWVYGSAAAWILGFAMMLAANDGIFFSNKVYRYVSLGVILAGEPETIFEKQDEILSLRQMARVITHEQFASQLADFKANRVRPVTVELPAYRGNSFRQPERNGYRRFDLLKTQHVQAFGNRILQFLGAIVFASGFAGVFIEWRLRRIRTRLR